MSLTYASGVRAATWRLWVYLSDAVLSHTGKVIDEIVRRLEQYQYRELPAEGRPRAAVLIPLYEVRDELHVVLTQRSTRVEHHKGEICFPGGGMELTDPDLAFRGRGGAGSAAAPPG